MTMHKAPATLARCLVVVVPLTDQGAWRAGDELGRGPLRRSARTRQPSRVEPAKHPIDRVR